MSPNEIAEVVNAVLKRMSLTEFENISVPEKPPVTSTRHNPVDAVKPTLPWNTSEVFSKPAAPEPVQESAPVIRQESPIDLVDMDDDLAMALTKSIQQDGMRLITPETIMLQQLLRNHQELQNFLIGKEQLMEQLKYAIELISKNFLGLSTRLSDLEKCPPPPKQSRSKRSSANSKRQK